jgi:hypothetical protein
MVHRPQTIQNAPVIAGPDSFLIAKNPARNDFDVTATADRQATLFRRQDDRTLPKIASEPKLAYARLMKCGLDERFWLEYVFEAYARHRADAVFPMGLPDIPESRPHSRVDEDRDMIDIGA